MLANAAVLTWDRGASRSALARGSSQPRWSAAKLTRATCRTRIAMRGSSPGANGAATGPRPHARDNGGAKARPPSSGRTARGLALVLRPPVDDALCLAGRALDSAGLDHAHRRRHADELLDVAAQELALRLAGAGVGEILPGLDQHPHGVEPAFTRHLDLVMRRKAGAAQDLLLDLRRKHVDPADDEHVVGAAGD